MAETKIKDSLKKLLIGELKEKKEEERLERVKLNANLKKVTIYTDKSQPHVKRLIDSLTAEGIKFQEYEASENLDKVNQITTITSMRTFPMVEINENILLYKRDFNNPQQLIGLIKFYADPNFEIPSFERKMLEQSKTNSYNLFMKIQQLEQKLNPIIGFVTNLQKQLAEEEAAEKKENEQKNK